jgi:hypothetical protein
VLDQHDLYASGGQRVGRRYVVLDPVLIDGRDDFVAVGEPVTVECDHDGFHVVGRLPKCLAQV